MIRKVFLAAVKGYRYLSVLLPGSCRYYPTCSAYALWQFQTAPLHLALFATLRRILRCNQLFAGGIDYPVVPKPPYRYPLSPATPKIDVKFWYIPHPRKKNRCLLIASHKEEPLGDPLLQSPQNNPSKET